MRAAAVALLLTLPAWADDWPTAQRIEIFSSNGERFVRITPGDSIGETVGFAGAAKGRHARAEHYQRQADRSFRLISDFEILNPVAPVASLLSNEGRLIAFDNWHNAGYGAVVAIYSPQGETVASYTLDQLYIEADLAKIPASVSSRWWRCKPWGWSDPGAETKVYVHEALGGYFVFNLTDGSKTYEPGSSPCNE